LELRAERLCEDQRLVERALDLLRWGRREPQGVEVKFQPRLGSAPWGDLERQALDLRPPERQQGSAWTPEREPPASRRWQAATRFLRVRRHWAGALPRRGVVSLHRDAKAPWDALA
jgi:hypothetical protein